MNVLRDLLVLLVMAAAPAGLVLFLIRQRLGAAGGRFWSPFGVGLFVLSLLAVGLIAWATSVSEAEMNACRAADAGTSVGCEDAGLLVGIAGMGSILTVALYVVAGLLLHAWLRRAAADSPKP